MKQYAREGNPFAVRDPLQLRRFYKIHNACVQLREAIKVIYDSAPTNEDINDMVKNGSQLEQSIGVSPAMSVASYLKMEQRSLDIESVFQRYKFENADLSVHQFVRYPVVTNMNLENLAFVHRSVPNMNVNLTEAQKTVMSNERLEFLGDSWLGAFVAYVLYRKYPFSEEGALSRMKNAIVNNNNLGKLS